MKTCETGTKDITFEIYNVTLKKSTTNQNAKCSLGNSQVWLWLSLPTGDLRNHRANNSMRVASFL